MPDCCECSNRHDAKSQVFKDELWRQRVQGSRRTLRAKADQAGVFLNPLISIGSRKHPRIREPADLPMLI
jgi:hypothetical protein